MLSDSLVESFRARLDALGLELADLRIGGTQHRPLVQVRIEWPPSEPPRRVTVDDCGTASRALEGAHRGRSRRGDGRARAPRGSAAVGAAGRDSRRAFGRGLVTRNP